MQLRLMVFLQGACVLSINAKAVAIKSIECSIIDHAFERGWMKPQVSATFLIDYQSNQSNQGNQVIQQINPADSFFPGSFLQFLCTTIQIFSEAIHYP